MFGIVESCEKIDQALIELGHTFEEKVGCKVFAVKRARPDDVVKLPRTR